MAVPNGNSASGGQLRPVSHHREWAWSGGGRMEEEQARDQDGEEGGFEPGERGCSV